MGLKERVSGIHWRWAQRRFGIWGVRDYYTLLEQMASEGAEITFGYVLMILAAALLATAGLLLNSPAAIIGAMCVAPFLGPSRAVCSGDDPFSGLLHAQDRGGDAGGNSLGPQHAVTRTGDAALWGLLHSPQCFQQEDGSQ
jgi:hypothetical protein